MSKLYYKSISELAPLIKNKELSPVELTKTIIQRIKDLDGTLNSYITTQFEEALEQARVSEQEIMNGNYKSALHGIPMGMKDLLSTRGLRTTSGAKILENNVPDFNATVIDKLMDAGMILTGKLSCHEYAFGATNENPHFGNTLNPWDTKRISGGSSGGSGVAVAAGLSVASLGTDTGGSIRTPSSLCGIVGLKPTFGLVSKFGMDPLAWTLDHVGPMARKVEDLALILEVVAGYDERDPMSIDVESDQYSQYVHKGVKGLKIGVPTNYYFDGIHPEVEAKVKTALKELEALGAELIEVNIPELSMAMYAEMVTICVEPAAFHHETLKDRTYEYGQDVRNLIAAGELFTGVDYVKSQQARRVIREAFERTFKEIDVIIAPTLPTDAPLIGEREVDIKGETKMVLDEFVRLAAPCNLTGLPSLSIPVGFTDRKLPVSMQIIGNAFDEGTLIQVASAYEAISPMQGQVPIE